MNLELKNPSGEKAKRLQEKKKSSELRNLIWITMTWLIEERKTNRNTTQICIHKKLYVSNILKMSIDRCEICWVKDEIDYTLTQCDGHAAERERLHYKVCQVKDNGVWWG